MTPDDLPRATSAAELSPETDPPSSRPLSRRALREARERETRARQNAAPVAAPPSAEAPARPPRRGLFAKRDAPAPVPAEDQGRAEPPSGGVASGGARVTDSAVRGGALAGEALPGAALPGAALPGGAATGGAASGGARVTDRAEQGGALAGGAATSGAASGGALPGEAASRGALTGNAALREAVPSGARVLPGEASSGGTLPDGTTSGGTPADEATSAEAASGAALPGNAASREAAQGGAGTLPDEAAPGRTPADDATSAEAASVGALPGNAASGGVASADSAPRLGSTPDDAGATVSAAPVTALGDVPARTTIIDPDRPDGVPPRETVWGSGSPVGAGAGRGIPAHDDPSADDITTLLPAPAEPGDPQPIGLVDQVEPVDVEPVVAAPGEVDPATEGSEPQSAPRAPALEWVDPALVADGSATAGFSTAPHRPVTGPDLLPPRRRVGLSTLAPVATAGVLAVGYLATCVLWPLDAVTPKVSAQQVAVTPGTALSVNWPANGSAALAPVGLLDRAAVGSSTALPIASITKLVSVLMILEKQPLAPGEQGPSYDFTWEDRSDYLSNYLWAGQSSLDVPVDGSLTQYQMLEGILMGSANNYVNRLVREIWGSNEAFAAEASQWLEANGLNETTIVEASGIDPGNTATASDVLRLGELALQHPVVAEIVAKQSTTLPGNDEPVENSNPLLGEDGIVGIKTGTLDEWNLVTAKRVDVGGESITVVAAVLGQPDADARTNVSRELLDAATASLQPVTAVPAGTVVASVATEWGTSADIVTAEDASLVLWNGALAPVEHRIGDVLGELSGDAVGELTATGSFESQTVQLELTDDIGVPSLGWRLAHPLELLGLR